ncbi:MAG: hypothetical protein K2N61_14925 [Lachnospiraceae bacterium]|nr:hypothetical protein [Lachnospiraceae bacterium]
MDSQEVYEKYRLGKGKLKALEALPVKEIFQKVKEKFSDWKQDMETSDEESCRFICPEQKEYWTDTHFWIFLYGREANGQKETQMVRFSCHNMNEHRCRLSLHVWKNLSVHYISGKKKQWNMTDKYKKSFYKIGR